MQLLPSPKAAVAEPISTTMFRYRLSYSRLWTWQQLHRRTPLTKQQCLDIGSATAAFGLGNSYTGRRTPQIK